MNITWTILNLERQISNGFVTLANWRCTASDENSFANTSSFCAWVEGTPKIAYADVTEAMVLDWVWSNGVNKQETETALKSQLEYQKQVLKANGLPWVN